MNIFFRMLFITILLLFASACTPVNTDLTQGTYRDGDDYITVGQEKHIVIKIACLPLEVYYYPYEYCLIEKHIDNEKIFQIVLHNKLSSKQYTTAEGYQIYYIPERHLIKIQKDSFSAQYLLYLEDDSER